MAVCPLFNFTATLFAKLRGAQLPLFDGRFLRPDDHVMGNDPQLPPHNLELHLRFFFSSFMEGFLYITKGRAHFFFFLSAFAPHCKILFSQSFAARSTVADVKKPFLKRWHPFPPPKGFRPRPFRVEMSISASDSRRFRPRSAPGFFPLPTELGESFFRFPRNVFCSTL